MNAAEHVEAKCAQCAKTKEQTGSPLQHCGGCKVKYCSRACQVQDWRSHKKSCGIEFDKAGCVVQKMPARVAPGDSHLSRGMIVDFKNANDMIRVQTSEETAYKLLIEAWRVSDEDVRAARGTLHLDKSNPRSEYIVGHSFAGLQNFITKVEAKPTALPLWWGPSSGAACLDLAKDMYHWSDIKSDVPKEIDDFRRYGGPGVRLPLRFFASTMGVGSMGALFG